MSSRLIINKITIDSKPNLSWLSTLHKDILKLKTLKFRFDFLNNLGKIIPRVRNLEANVMLYAINRITFWTKYNIVVQLGAKISTVFFVFNVSMKENLSYLESQYIMLC